MAQATQIVLTKLAIEQIKLILDHDFTLYEASETPALRITITGKECHGFNYGIGLDKAQENDIINPYEMAPDQKILVVMDPFCAHFLQNITIDYKQDFAGDAEGLVVINHDHSDFAGKFWKGAPEKAPQFK